MKPKIDLKSVIWALIFSGCFTISTYCLSEYSFPVPIALVIIAVNALIFAVYTISLIKGISLMDEVQIRIQLEAVAVAFALSLLLVMILGLVGLVRNLGLEPMNYLYTFPLLFFFYLIGFFISQRRYR
jgi:hypothetical protein